MTDISTKPYLIRAIFEWCADNGLTPYLAVTVDKHTIVPMEYVKNGEIVLNIGRTATRSLVISNDLIQFSARFNGVSRNLSIPMDTVTGIFAKENGQGLFFPPDEHGPGQKRGATPSSIGNNPHDKPPSPGKGKPKLKIVK